MKSVYLNDFEMKRIVKIVINMLDISYFIEQQIIDYGGIESRYFELRVTGFRSPSRYIDLMSGIGFD